MLDEDPLTLVLLGGMTTELSFHSGETLHSNDSVGVTQWSQFRSSDSVEVTK